MFRSHHTHLGDTNRCCRELTGRELSGTRAWVVKGRLAGLATPSGRSRERSERCPLQRAVRRQRSAENPTLDSTRAPFVGAKRRRTLIGALIQPFRQDIVSGDQDNHTAGPVS
jgi:hypothetical protein